MRVDWIRERLKKQGHRRSSTASSFYWSWLRYWWITIFTWIAWWLKYRSSWNRRVRRNELAFRNDRSNEKRWNPRRVMSEQSGTEARSGGNPDGGTRQLVICFAGVSLRVVSELYRDAVAHQRRMAEAGSQWRSEVCGAAKYHSTRSPPWRCKICKDRQKILRISYTWNWEFSPLPRDGRCPCTNRWSIITITVHLKWNVLKAYKYAYSPHTQSSYRKYYQIDSGRLLWRAKLNSFYET